MGIGEIDETALWRAAKASGGRAFGQVFDAHYARVYGRALQATGSVHDAEEVTAVVFFECWRLRDRVRVVDGSIIGWLLLTTTNVARNLTRSRRRYGALLERLPEPAVHPDHADDVADRLDRAELDERMRAEFSTLSARDREVLVLCLVEGLSASAAAELLDVPEGTVKSRLARARKRLSTALGDQLDPRPLPDAPRLPDPHPLPDPHLHPAADPLEVPDDARS
ncbi:sigma-70 family RNA polymerase sigma factor [Herbiconiux sp.]|uniref:RNA polymerase sigma factor n=1 Tax=Herbiconiux sp. TaxID=1871186 RepID=UPI0025BFD959|nr:sigma-70 family RNA polymerase sigma factor [Herbiconiux sp.]